MGNRGRPIEPSIRLEMPLMMLWILLFHLRSTNDNDGNSNGGSSSVGDVVHVSRLGTHGVPGTATIDLNFRTIIILCIMLVLRMYYDKVIRRCWIRKDKMT